MLIPTRVGRLFVDERGDGPPLVLWPSLLCNGGMWRFQVPILAEHHRVLTIDPPGHGRSAPMRRAFTIEECADAVVDLLDALAIDRTDFAGLSWGGMTAMRLALAHPSRVRSLALLDTSAHAEVRRKLPSYTAMLAIALTLGPGVPLLLDRVEPLMFAKHTRVHHRDRVRDFRDHLARMDRASLGRAVEAVIFRRTDVTAQLARIAHPTLVIVGRDDVATPPSKARAIAAAVAGAELVEIPDAGHLATLDQPEKVTDLLVRFFRRGQS